MTRIFIENQELDISEGLSNFITYAIDDLQNLDSKATPFTKTIVIPGTTKNNATLGNIFEITNSNFTNDIAPNVGYNYNASKAAKCRIEVNGLQMIKGVFRLLEILIDGKFIEYECAVFGELGGFIASLSNKRLEDLDFSAYDHDYTPANMVASWSLAYPNGTGYYYPMIDYGNVSIDKHDYQYTAFRPALFLREYIDKIITGNGYTWECDFFNTDFFKRLIIPNNDKALLKFGITSYVDAVYTGSSSIMFAFPGVVPPRYPRKIPFASSTLNNFTTSDGINFKHIGATNISAKITLQISGHYTSFAAQNNPLYIEIVTPNGTETHQMPFSDGLPSIAVSPPGFTVAYNVTMTLTASFAPNDEFFVQFRDQNTINERSIACMAAKLDVIKDPPGFIELLIGDSVNFNTNIPKGVLQKDLFISVLKLFYLMVTEDKFKERHLIIKPWIDFFNTDRSTFLDWSNKIDRGQVIRMKPMSELNARFYQLKFRQDNDFYNEDYRKKYNVGYGDYVYDTAYDFAKETETVEVIFAGSVLIAAPAQDKVTPGIMKRSGGIEEPIAHVIRLMQKKVVEGVSEWLMLNIDTTIATSTQYPYAGHFNDPDAPDSDINFGATSELYFNLVAGDLTRNLFNSFYSPYMAEITDKDSRLLRAKFKLSQQDIFDLDYSRFIYLDGALFRIVRIIDFNTEGGDLTQVELLRVIYTTY